MRGKVVELTLSRSFCGITPAHAGKSEGRLQLRLRAGDHPRACGEKTEYSLPHIEPKGSPPRMRGKVRCCMPLLRASGITPAHAGKSMWLQGQNTARQDHPRACGEKPRVLEDDNSKIGITPAHAGKRLPPHAPQPGQGDHPRACGEKCTSRMPLRTSLGSPPRMRGKVARDGQTARRFRITPAHAGKSWFNCNPGSPQQDHPRACGEKQSGTDIPDDGLGSPPRMRGKD